MPAPRVLFYTLTDKGSQIQRSLEQLELTGQLDCTTLLHKAGTTPTAEQLAGFDAVVGEYMPVRGASVEAFAAAGVKLVASMSIGVNHLDVAGLEQHGIQVTNCPGYCQDEVATQALALLLALNRKLVPTHDTVLAGEWDPKAGHPMHRLQGQTLGLVYFGHIARTLTPMALGLGLKVLVWAPTKTAEQIAALGAQKADTLQELLGASDAVSLHCPLIPETVDLMNQATFAQMKPGAFLINTARGEVVDEDALLDALDSGQVGAAGLDVVRHEYDDRNRRLIEHPRVLVTPHCAFDSVEAEEALVRMSLASCGEVLVKGVTPTYLVRPEG